MVATDPKNHAELDLDSTAVDSNGDPFYTKLSGVPDSLAVWVKFKQGGEVAGYPYATVSAAITDGTYYQEPNDKEYTNIVARGGNKEIASNGFVWQRICFPFTAVNATLDPKAILVTISTNAAPGKGTGTDSLYVDDLSLIYNQDIMVKGISVQGQPLTLADNMKYETLTASVLTLDDFVVDTDAKRVIKTVDVTNERSMVSIFVASEDLKTFKTYTVSTPSRVATGIDAVGTSTAGNSSAADGIYTLSGQRTTVMKPDRYISSRRAARPTKPSSSNTCCGHLQTYYTLWGMNHYRFVPIFLWHDLKVHGDFIHKEWRLIIIFRIFALSKNTNHGTTTAILLET